MSRGRSTRTTSQRSVRPPDGACVHIKGCRSVDDKSTPEPHRTIPRHDHIERVTPGRIGSTDEKTVELCAITGDEQKIRARAQRFHDAVKTSC
jgi:hypothetical protein